MGFFDQLDVDAVKASLRADLPTPIDVLNLVHFKDEEAYKWYGVMVLPLLKAVGARVGWVGKHRASLLGEPRAEELVVVRYPNQRRFFSLTLNPYYAVVANPQRLKAVKRFEASFTHSDDGFGPLRKSEWLLCVHSHESSAPADEALREGGGTCVYRSVETSPIKIAKRDHPANTNPLVYKHTALIRFDSEQQAIDALTPGVLNQLQEIAEEPSLQLYQRVPKTEAMPAQVSKLLARV
jgi:uncharacterized protein (DUF1330 family)